MIRAALVLFALLLLVQLAGWRGEVAFLSGTRVVTTFGLCAGLTYLAAWFLGVVVAPVLLVSGVVRGVLARAQRPH